MRLLVAFAAIGPIMLSLAVSVRELRPGVHLKAAPGCHAKPGFAPYEPVCSARKNATACDKFNATCVWIWVVQCIII